MELANQYGINLGNVYKTVSDLKGADQDREVKTEQLNKYRSEKNKALNEEDIAKAKRIIEQHGKAALYAKQNVPEGQRGQYIAQYVSTLPQETQQAFTQKYGTDPAQIEAKIPFMLNDIINADKELEAMAKEKAEKQKHADTLEGKGVQGAIDYSLQELKNKGFKERTEATSESKEEVANIYAGSREKVAGMKGASVGGSRSQKAKLLSYDIKTVTDPKTGAKTTTRVNKWDDGSTTTSAPSGELKPPPPLVKQSSKGATYKPSDVVKYGTKDGRKVAQMKDGSIIYVK